MTPMKKLGRATNAGGRDAPTIDELRHQVASLTEANAALRQQVEELSARQTAIDPIMFSLLNNPFADVEWLRHKLRKALRPRNQGS